MARSVVRGAKMSKIWRDIGPGSSPLNTHGLTTLLGTLDFNQPETILRMVGEYSFQPDTTSAAVAGDRAVITVGIGLVSLDAAVAGATALPDPDGDSQYDWLYWHAHSYYVGTILTNPVIALRHQIDVRSMRRAKARQTLVFLVQFDIESLTPVVRFMQPRIRVLVGLP